MSLLKGRLAALLSSRRVCVLAGWVAFLLGVRVLLSVGGVGYRPADPLVEFELGQVAGIELRRGQGEPVVLSRGEGGWVVTSHGGLPAHAGVDAILARVRSWRRERLAGDDPDAQVEWQVDAAQTRELKLFDVEGQVLADLLIGGITGIEVEDVREQGFALDTNRLGLFVRPRGEDRVYVVTEFVTGELEPDPARWFRQPALEIDPGSLRAVAVVRGDARAVVQLQPEPQFVNDTRPVDTDVLQGLLHALARIEVRGPAQGAPPEDAVRFEVEPIRGDPFALAAWRVGERCFVALPERTLEVGRLVGWRLSQLQPDDLVRKRWCLQPPERVVEIELTRPDGVDRLERRPGNRWRYERVVGGVSRVVEVSADRLKPFVHALAGLEVSGWAAPPAGRALPWRLVLRDLQGRAAVLRFDKSEQHWPAEVEGVGGARLDGALLGGILDRLAGLHQ